MKTIIVFTILLLGVLAGFAFFYDTDTTIAGAAIKCSMDNEECFCSDQYCECGNTTIREEECHSNSNR
jgi:hypothetical protein